MNNRKTFFYALILISLAFNASSQSINFNFTFTTRCSEDTLSIPITTTGSFTNQSAYIVNFIGIDYAPSFTTNANRVGDKLFIKLPQLYSTTKIYDKYALQISSTNPTAVSSVSNSQISISYQTWATMIATGNYNYSTIITNNHINPGEELQLFVNNKGHWDEGLKLKFRGGYTTNTPYISNGIRIKPVKDTTYKLLSISTNQCGYGIIQGNDSLRVAVNPFAFMITQISPTIICPNQKFIVHYSSSGIFNSQNQFQLQFQTDNGNIFNIPSPTINIESNTISANLPTNIPAGTYNVRVISTDPIVYSNFSRVKVSPSPSISISTIPSSRSDTISLGESILLQLNMIGEPLFSVRLNDSIFVAPNYYSNNWAQINVSPKQTTNFRITSFETACGQTNDINISKTIYVRDNVRLDSIPKKYYCQGEIIKMKFQQSGVFATNNRFIAQLKQYNGYIDLDTQTNGDSIFITVPNQNFDYTYENGFNLRIKSTNPQIIGGLSPNTFFIKRKPTAKLLPYINYTTTPDIVPLKIEIAGHRPYTLVLSDGQTYQVESNSFTEMRTQEEVFLKVFVPQTTTFSITNLYNDCGYGTYSGSHTIQVTQPNQPTIKLRNDYLLTAFCKGQSYTIPIYTSGNFAPENVFIVEIGQFNNTNRIEIGRSTSNNIPINIPANLTNEYRTLYIKSTNPAIEMISTIVTTGVPSASIDYAFTDLTFDNYNYTDTIKILKNEKVRFGVNINGANGPYNLSFSNSQTYIPVLNSSGNPYFNPDIQSFTFNFSENHIFSITKIANSCGVGPVSGNSRVIRQIPFRITPKIRYTDFSLSVCEGTNIFIPYEVEGILPNGANLKVEIAKQNTNNFITLPVINQGNPIEVKIPIGVEEGVYGVRVICTNCGEGKYLLTNGITIKKKASASFKLQNNLDSTSINGGQSVQLKLILSGSYNFNALLNDGSQYNISSLEYLISKTPISSQTYKLSYVGNSCGYASNNDSIRVKVLNKLTFSIDNTVICKAKALNANYTIYGDYGSTNSNKFILVSPTGSTWDLKTVLNNQGVASLNIPSNIPDGQYSIRLTSSSPSISYSVNVSIIDVPVVELEGNSSVVQGETTTLKVKLISPSQWQTANYEMSDGYTSILGGGYLGYSTVSTKPVTTTSTIFIRKISNSCGNGISSGNSLITVIPKSNTHSIQLWSINSICKGAESLVYFTKTGTYQPTNTFKLFLSDKNGSNFTEIPAEYIATSNLFKATIPSDLELGNNYRLLVRSTDPLVSSSSSNPLSLYNAPSASFIDTVYYVPTNGTLQLTLKLNNSGVNNTVWVTLNNSNSSTGLTGSIGTIYISNPIFKSQTFKITKVYNSECSNGIIGTPFVAKVCNESLTFLSGYYSGYDNSYQTEKTITSSSNFNGSNIDFKAGTSISLLPGFKFEANVNNNLRQFSAQINGCVR